MSPICKSESMLSRDLIPGSPWMSDTQQWTLRRDNLIHGPASAVELKNFPQAKHITLQHEEE